MRLKSLVAGAVASLAMTAVHADELSFANYMAPTHPYVGGAFEPFANLVAEKTGNALTIRLYNGGELGAGPDAQYDRVVEGVADLAVSLPGYTASTFPLTLLTELPGVIDEATGTEKIWKNIQLFEPEYQRVKLISLWSSAANLLYTKKPVRTPADLAGLNIRVPSRNAGLLVEAWGGSPVSMPVSEIYTALQTGVIDGAMIDGTATTAFKLGEVADYLTVGIESTISPFSIVMNRDEFNALSAEQQAALEAAGKEASALGSKTQLTVAAGGIKAFADLPGKEVIKLTEYEARAFHELNAPVVAKIISDVGGNAQAVVDALAK
ncbi:TRAP transporter substrate-binding protein [Devosia sp. 919]|uniref:TRAP transporter substrate-binding protein n=1 Tax=Devosia sp. 919 TaxID=2726065 RepID=UPI001551BF9E|nr:TRAP transporter substrate-binding protein [Devosia sp. 919]